MEELFQIISSIFSFTSFIEAVAEFFAYYEPSFTSIALFLTLLYFIYKQIFKSKETSNTVTLIQQVVILYSSKKKCRQSTLLSMEHEF